MNDNSDKYFKDYRERIGFSNKVYAKNFLSGKDLKPKIDFEYIDALNERLVKIIEKINQEIYKDYSRVDDFSRFTQMNIFCPYKIIKKSDLIPKLNNQGRRPETVLFSWLRGYAVAEYFTPVFAKLFNVPLKSITQIGDDDLSNIDTFKRSPKADLEIIINNQKIRLEVQSGFQGVNDIKEHKVREAHKIFSEKKIKSICIHIDLFNGQVAFVQLDSIKKKDVNFVTRQQMEGQSVFSIDQNYFKWRLTDKLPDFNALELSI